MVCPEVFQINEITCISDYRKRAELSNRNGRHQFVNLYLNTVYSQTSNKRLLKGIDINCGSVEPGDILTHVNYSMKFTLRGL